KTFAIVDAGMNDLIRPALYHSYHEIVPVEERNTITSKRAEKIDIVGPVCESGDFFALDREMPELHEGDLLAIMSAGAYGLVMASNYNSRPLPAEALVRGNQLAPIRKRQTWEDLVAGEYIILVGGPSMYQWEKYKTYPHDHWWANFIRAARIRTEQLRTELGSDAKITWLVYRQGYEDRAKQEHQDLISLIGSVRDK